MTRWPLASPSHATNAAAPATMRETARRRERARARATWAARTPPRARSSSLSPRAAPRATREKARATKAPATIVASSATRQQSAGAPRAENAASHEVEEVEEDAPKDVGGVWLIAHVSAKKVEPKKSAWKPSRRSPRTWEKFGPQHVKLSNRFQAFEEQGKESAVKAEGMPEQAYEKQAMQGLTKMQRLTEINAVEAKLEACGMTFHLTDAKRMLASVDKITEAGNEVKFGPLPKDNFVRNLMTGKTIPLKKKQGVYVMEVLFVVGDKHIVGEIIVDSGAAECVMPRDFLPSVETFSAKAGVRFAASNGGEMGNYGRKLITFVPRDFSARV